MPEFEQDPAMEMLSKDLARKYQQQGGPCMEMPRYKCHKVVHALKIASIAFDRDKAQQEGRETDGGAIITPADDGYAPFPVDFAYVRKHNPQAGGYYVIYEDGYQSFSPAKAFEDGYTRI